MLKRQKLTNAWQLLHTETLLLFRPKDYRHLTFALITYYRMGDFGPHRLQIHLTSLDLTISLDSITLEGGKKDLFPPGIEPGTFRVLGGCDNHYTTETRWRKVASLSHRF